MFDNLISMPPAWGAMIIALLCLGAATIYLWMENVRLKDQQENDIDTLLSTLTSNMATISEVQANVTSLKETINTLSRAHMEENSSETNKILERVGNILTKISDISHELDKQQKLPDFITDIRDDVDRVREVLIEFKSNVQKSNEILRESVSNVNVENKSQHQHLGDVLDRQERSTDAVHREIAGLSATINGFIASLPFTINKNLKS